MQAVAKLLMQVRTLSYGAMDFVAHILVIGENKKNSEENSDIINFNFLTKSFTKRKTIDISTNGCY